MAASNNSNEHKTYFDNIREELSKELRGARHTIFAAVAWLTDEHFLSILQSKAASGVSVQLIISGSDYNEKHRYRNLNAAGGEIYIFGGGDIFDYGFMHNKFCVIDYKKVITGSFNWTKNASSNEENIVVINDERVAFSYTQKCLELIKQAEVVDFDDSNDIRISFAPETTLVDVGTNLKIDWKVENANVISITKIGDNLSAIGTHSVRIDFDTTLILTAQNETFSKSKSLNIRTVKYPKVLFFSISEKATIRGQSVKLSWDTENADKVVIDNGVGELGHSGEIQVAPIKDTIYKLTAIGETKEADSYVSIIVYPLPTVKTIAVPTPTMIKLEADIGLHSSKIPTSLKVDSIKSDLVQRVPKIDFLQSEVLPQPLPIRDIANALGVAAHELVTPSFKKTTAFKYIKKSILDKLEDVFQHNWKASQVISQIRKSYEI